MQVLCGKMGVYIGNMGSFYLKYMFNIYGIFSDRMIIILVQLYDFLNFKKFSIYIVVFDMGVVFGYVFIWKIKCFQVGVLGGFGLVI